jgi:hypothetical protein
MIFCQELDGGVRAGEPFGSDSLILIPLEDFPMGSLILIPLEDFRLPAWVFEAPH